MTGNRGYEAAAVPAGNPLEPAVATAELRGRPRMRLEDYKFGWWPCCDHCGCGTPDGIWPSREGHDDTCAKGCNDE